MQTTPISNLPYPELGDVPNAQTAFSGLAVALDDIVVPRFSNASARNAAISSPTAGQVCYLTDSDSLQVYSGSAWTAVGRFSGSGSGWTSYTPTWNTTSGSPTIGNGSITGAYTRVGDIVTASVRLSWGSSTSSPSGGSFRISLPVAGNSEIGAGACVLYDSSTASGRQSGVAWHADANTIRFNSGVGGEVTGTAPFTWGDGDQLRATITYQAA